MFQPLARGHIGFIGWYFIGLLVYLVFATFRARQRIARMPKLPTRTRHFISTIIVLGLLLVGALLVARVDGIPLFPRAWPTPLQAGVGLALALVLAAGMRPFWRRAVATGDRRLYLFSPTTPREKGLWIGVSLMAGVAEETVYRGVLYVLLLTVTRSPWAAAGLSALIFAGNHAVQSNRSMVIIFLFSLLFQALALWSGALYAGMLAHVVFDVIAGFTYSKLVREMGYRAQGEPETVAVTPEPAG